MKKCPSYNNFEIKFVPIAIFNILKVPSVGSACHYAHEMMLKQAAHKLTFAGLSC